MSFALKTQAVPQPHIARVYIRGVFHLLSWLCRAQPGPCSIDVSVFTPERVNLIPSLT